MHGFRELLLGDSVKGVILKFAASGEAVHNSPLGAKDAVPLRCMASVCTVSANFIYRFKVKQFFLHGTSPFSFWKYILTHFSASIKVYYKNNTKAKQSGGCRH